MVHSLGAELDASFAALSDATRRGVLDELGRDAASIKAHRASPPLAVGPGTRRKRAER